MVNLTLASIAVAALVWSEERLPMKLDPHVVGKQATSAESFNPDLFHFAFHSLRCRFILKAAFYMAMKILGMNI